MSCHKMLDIFKCFASYEQIFWTCFNGRKMADAHNIRPDFISIAKHLYFGGTLLHRVCRYLCSCFMIKVS